MSRFLACCLCLLASPALADYYLTENLVIDESTQDVFGRSGDVRILDGAHVEVVGDNQVLRDYVWHVYDGSLNYTAGNGAQIDSPFGNMLMTGGNALGLQGQGTISGGTADVISVDGDWLITGDATAGRVRVGEFGNLLVDSGVIEGELQTYRLTTITGGTVNAVTAAYTDTTVSSVLIAGGDIRGPLKTEANSVIKFFGAGLKVEGGKLTGRLDDGTQISADVSGNILVDNFPHVPGDVDDDDAVGLNDMNQLRNNFGELGLAGDLDRDGVIGLSDLNLVRNSFGVSGGSSVPEPSSLSIMVLAAIGLAGIPLRHRCRWSLFQCL